MSLTALIWLTGCAATHVQEVPTPVPGGVRFVVTVSAAETVAVVGSFNGWSPTAHIMTRVGSNGFWTAVVPLASGEHAFMYLVDGTTWVVPPAAEDFVMDGFGNTNGVVIVPEGWSDANPGQGRDSSGGVSQRSRSGLGGVDLRPGP